MGNSGLPSMNTISMDVDTRTLKQSGLLKIDNTNHVVFKDPKNSSLYLQHILPFQTDQDYKAIHKAISDTKRMSRFKILKIHNAQVEDRRLTCNISTFKIYTEYFEKNLKEILDTKQVQTYFPTESRFWRLIFSISEILAFFADNNIECNMVHPRSIYYNISAETFGLIHPVFFKENNFTEALNKKQHFCSPELYYQILSRNKRFMLVEGDKSNSFSLGLIVLYIIWSVGGLDLDEIYNKEVISVGVAKIKQLIGDLRSRGFSQLFANVIMDLTSEFEHVRLAPKNLINSLAPYRAKLEADTFSEQDTLIEEYHKRTNMSENYDLNGKMSHAFGFDGADEINASQNLNSDEVVKNLKGKAQPFNNRYLAQDNSF